VGRSSPHSHTILRWIAAPLFGAGGFLWAWLMLFGGAPSFWHVPCACALPVLGFVWAWRPQFAAVLSVGPLVSVAVMAVAAALGYTFGLWYTLVLGGTFAAAIVLIIATVRGYQRWKLPLVISLVFVGAAFATDRLFTNVHVVRTFPMVVSLDGKTPWGEDNRSPPVVIYRAAGEGYCFDAFFSSELRQRLAPKQGQTVQVEYNTWSDFGRVRGYNVRSVDGMILAVGDKPIKDIQWYGGAAGIGSGTTPRCW
jgi:hypothetical protein